MNAKEGTLYFFETSVRGILIWLGVKNSNELVKGALEKFTKDNKETLGEIESLELTQEGVELLEDEKRRLLAGLSSVGDVAVPITIQRLKPIMQGFEKVALLQKESQRINSEIFSDQKRKT